MGLWDKIRGEFIDIIEWTDSSNDTMVWRFERYGNEIKNGAKLTVRESQVAVFVSEGELADVFEPGMYTLETKNLPILSTILGWKYGFSSPFKAEVYFVNTRRFTDLKWGTKNPIMLRDPEFGPVRVRAFGTYAMRVTDAAKFIREIVGTDGHFTKEEVTGQLRNLVVSRFADALGESKTAVLDLAGNYDELSTFITDKIAPEFEDYGLNITKLLVENISLPPSVEEALDKRTSMGVLGNMQNYMQYQTANAIPEAAKNPGGGGMAASGMGLGMGMAMANQMSQTMQPQSTHAVPPPVPNQGGFFVAVNGQQTGPYNMVVLGQQVSAGQLKAQSLVWRPGMMQWTAAGQVTELASLFHQTPPPLPGQMPPPLPPTP